MLKPRFAEIQLTNPGLCQIPTTTINPDSDGDGPFIADRNQAASNTFRMEVETNALVCDEILGHSRHGYFPPARTTE